MLPVIAALLTAGGLGLLWQTWRPGRAGRRWTHVEGRLLETNHLSSDPESAREEHAVRASFRALDGQEVTGWALDTFDQEIKKSVGGPIQVWYCPSDPQRFRASTQDTLGRPWFEYAFALVFTGIALVVLLKSMS